MKHTYSSFVLMLILLVAVAGCSTAGHSGPVRQKNRTVRAVRVQTPLKLDGRLEEGVWQNAPRYEMVRAIDNVEQRPDYAHQRGTVQLAWDDENLYLAARLEEDDIIGRGERDSRNLFQVGDVVELFLKPQNQVHYWEFHAAPNGKQTVLRLSAAGLMGLAGHRTDLDPSMEVAVAVNGTINDDNDRDAGWTVELAIPIVKIMGEDAHPWRAGQDWQVLAARYNYGRYLSHRGAELTMYPQLTRSSFHDVWEFATLILEP